MTSNLIFPIDLADDGAAAAEIEDMRTRTQEHVIIEQRAAPLIQGKDSPTPASKLGVEDGSLKEILRDILETLQDSSIAGPTAAKDDRSRFWGKYKRVAEEHDSEFLERYSSDMDIVLIFAGLFSAISTSFIVAMEPSLLPDPSDTTNALLLHIAQTLGNSSTPGYVPTMPTVPDFAGPLKIDVWVQTIAYLSLASSLLAAFGAVLGKQWLGYYKSNRYGRGTLEQRGHRRQEKFNGLKMWYFDAVLQSFPLLIQFSLLLFGLALSGHMWSEQRTIAGIIIVTTAFGVLFYLFTLFASLLSPACPFQSPLSAIFRLLWPHTTLPQNHIFQSDQQSRIYRACVRQLQASCQLLRAMLRVMKAIVHRVATTLSSSRSGPKDVETGSGQSSSESPIKLIPRKDDATAIISLDLSDTVSGTGIGAPSVLWLLETSTDPEVLLAASRMVPEVEWTLDLDVTAGSSQLYDMFLQSAHQEDLLRPGQHDNAVTYCRSLIHLDSEMDVQPPSPYRTLAYKSYLGEKYHLLNVFEIMFSVRMERDDKVTNFLSMTPERDVLQVLHLLPYAKFKFAYVEEYLQSSQRSLVLGVISSILDGKNYLTSESPGVPDCAMVIGRLLGLQFDLRDKRKLNKCEAFEKLLDVIYVKLAAIFPRDHHNTWNGSSWDLDERTANSEKILAKLTEHIAMDCLPFVLSLLPMVRAASSLGFLLVDGYLLISQVYFDKSIQKSNQKFGPSKHLGGKNLSYLQACARTTAKALNKGDPFWHTLGIRRLEKRFRAWNRSDHDNLKEASRYHPWLLVYLKHLCTTLLDDISDLQDALLISIYGLIDLRNSPEDIQSYLEIIIFCMGTDKPAELRHTALLAICAKRDIFLPPNEPSKYEQAALPVLAEFSVALLDMFCPTSKAKSLSGSENKNRHRSTNDSADWLPEDIDCYENIISALAQMSMGRGRIIHDGHLKFFISSFPVGTFSADVWNLLVPHFWMALAANSDRLLDQWSDIEEILPEIIRLTLIFANSADAVGSIIKEITDAETRVLSMLQDKGDNFQMVTSLFNDLREQLDGRLQTIRS